MAALTLHTVAFHPSCDPPGERDQYGIRDKVGILLYSTGDSSSDPGVAQLIMMDGDSVKPGANNPAIGVTGHEKTFCKAMGRLPESEDKDKDQNADKISPYRDVATGFGFNHRKRESHPRALTYDSSTFNASGEKGMGRALRLYTHFHDKDRSAGSSAPERELVERCWAVYEKGPSADGTFPRISLKATGEALYEYDPNDDDPSHIAAELGMGVFATTFRMRRKADGKLCAVKQIDVHRASRLGIDEGRVRKEARLLQMLDHPHVVAYVATCDFNRNRVFGIVMELLEGGSLGDKIATPPDPPVQVAEWMRQVASGVAHMHTFKMQHRDLKPDNVRTPPRDPLGSMGPHVHVWVYTMGLTSWDPTSPSTNSLSL